MRPVRKHGERRGRQRWAWKAGCSPRSLETIATQLEIPDESPYLHHLPRRPLRETPSRPSGARKFCPKFLNITIPSISSQPRALFAPALFPLVKEPVFLIAFRPALLASHARHVAPHARERSVESGALCVTTHACGTRVRFHRRRLGRCRRRCP